MPLAEYRRKRHFNKTAEPAGNAVKRRRADRLSYVIQKHAATRLHYDFRLELDGVLKSWAVPKGPSFDPGEKRLAVEVEDHPIEYATFEGSIPEGEYGAGEVIVWDRGPWSPVGDAHDGLKKGRLEFDLDGKKLHGRWILVRIHSRERSSKPNWLLIKQHDDFARPLTEYDVETAEPRSVKSGRKLEELAENTDAEDKWTRHGLQKAVKRRSKVAKAAVSNGKAANVRKTAVKKKSAARGRKKNARPRRS